MSTYRRLFVALGCASWIVAAGCSDNPVAGRAMAPHTDMVENYIPAPYPSVTNSNGTPLISWDAVPGATGYTVWMIYYQIDSITWEIYQFWPWEIATTTDTSYLDTANDYTGGYECPYSAGWGNPRIYLYTYAVQATFSDGSTSDINNSQVHAPITQC